MVVRLLSSIGGALLGVVVGRIAFCVAREQDAAFSWFLPLIFVAVFAGVSFVAGERFLQALSELISRL